jgi:hypothetical protein
MLRHVPSDSPYSLGSQLMKSRCARCGTNKLIKQNKKFEWGGLIPVYRLTRPVTFVSVEQIESAKMKRIEQLESKGVNEKKISSLVTHVNELTECVGGCGNTSVRTQMSIDYAG